MDTGKHYKSGLFGFVGFVSKSQFTSTPLNTKVPRKEKKKSNYVPSNSGSRCVMHFRRFQLQTVQTEGVWGLKKCTLSL